MDVAARPLAVGGGAGGFGAVALRYLWDAAHGGLDIPVVQAQSADDLICISSRQLTALLSFAFVAGILAGPGIDLLASLRRTCRRTLRSVLCALEQEPPAPARRPALLPALNA